MPGFQIRTHGAFTFAPLVHCDSGIVHNFEEGYDSLRFTIRSLDVRTKCSYRRPVIAKATRPLGQHGVVMNSAIDTVQIIGDSRQKTRRQLRP